MIINLKSLDEQRTYQVEDNVKGSGTKKMVFFNPDRKYVVAVYKAKPNPKSMERLRDLVGKHFQSLFDPQKNGDFWHKRFCWPYDIVESPKGAIGIVMPLYPEEFFFKKGDKKGIEKKGTWFTRPRLRPQIEASELGDWKGMLLCSLDLARTVRRLHLAGLCHSDLSFNNVLIDPTRGKVQIIDVDELVVPDKYEPGVFGTPGFMAPEVTATMGLPPDQQKLPSQQTDLFALSCLIYHYLLHRDPFIGKHRYDEDPMLDDQLAYGENALFVEDSRNPSNRPTPEGYQPIDWSDADKLPYTVVGPFIAKLFKQSFEEGAHNPQRRPSAAEWEDAIFRTYERLVPCSNPKCSEKHFVLNKDKRCPFCHEQIQIPMPVFDVYVKDVKTDSWKFTQTQIIGYNNRSLHKWHFFRNIFFDETLSQVDAAHVAGIQYFKDQWYITNFGLNNLEVVKNGQTNGSMLPVGKSMVMEAGMEFRNQEHDGEMLILKFI